MLLVISPHFDDAVLSMGEHMAANRRTQSVQVLTVFGGIPRSPEIQTEYDRKSGFACAADAVAGRTWEDDRAAAVLEVEKTWNLQFADHQYGEPPHEQKLIDQLRRRMIQNPLSGLNAVPLGIGHPDHIITSDYALSVVEKGPKEAYVYEELPGRAMQPPEVVVDRKNALRARGFRFEYEVFPAQPRRENLLLKRAAMTCYGSQMWALADLEPEWTIAERIWAVRWVG